MMWELSHGKYRPSLYVKNKIVSNCFLKTNLEYADFTFPCASAITSRHISCPHQPSKAGSSLFWNQYIISKVRNPIWSQKIHKPGLCSESSWKKDSIKNLVVRDNKVPFFFFNEFQLILPCRTSRDSLFRAGISLILVLWAVSVAVTLNASESASRALSARVHTLTEPTGLLWYVLRRTIAAYLH